MTDVSRARSIEARDQMIDLSFAIGAMINVQISKWAGVDIEPIDEFEHRVRRRLNLPGRKPVSQCFVVELFHQAEPIRARQRVYRIEDLAHGHCQPNIAAS